MCFGFVGKTFNLPSSAPRWMKHKQSVNRNFIRKALPQFRKKQQFLAMHGQGMLAEQENIYVDTTNASRNFSSSGKNYQQNQLRESPYSKNPRLSVSRKEVRVALGEARRNGNLMLGKSVNKR
jgi:hypothetical protein